MTHTTPIFHQPKPTLKRRHKRRHIEVLYEILDRVNQAKTTGINATKIMQLTNTSFVRNRRDLLLLIHHQLIKKYKIKGMNVYTITTKGNQVMREYQHVITTLKKTELYRLSNNT